jgi:hypothetical protein
MMTATNKQGPLPTLLDKQEIIIRHALFAVRLFASFLCILPSFLTHLLQQQEKEEDAQGENTHPSHARAGSGSFRSPVVISVSPCLMSCF